MIIERATLLRSSKNANQPTNWKLYVFPPRPVIRIDRVSCILLGENTVTTVLWRNIIVRCESRGISRGARCTLYAFSREICRRVHFSFDNCDWIWECLENFSPLSSTLFGVRVSEVYANCKTTSAYVAISNNCSYCRQFSRSLEYKIAFGTFFLTTTRNV